MTMQHKVDNLHVILLCGKRPQSSVAYNVMTADFTDGVRSHMDDGDKI